MVNTKEETEGAILQTSHPGVIITIAREHGSAGKYIGQLVAQKLGIPCYDKELTALAAQESGLAKEFISGINSDENAVMRELYLSTNAVRQAAPASTSCAWLHRGGEDRRADLRLHQPYVRKGGRELGMLPAALLWDSMGDGSYGHLRRSGSLLAVRMVRPVKAKMIAKTKLE